MPTYTNVQNIPLAAAVFLATDDYDYEENTISTTALIRPIRQLVLSTRIDPEDAVSDLSSRVNSRLGQAIHTAVEEAWKTNYKAALKSLGYPEHIIKRIKVNPPSALEDGDMGIYLEKRSHRTVDGYTLSGKFDFVAEGRVIDFKTTSVFTWVNQYNTDQYQLQGSIYRWLNPNLIKDDHMAIIFFFKDWSAAKAKIETNYPSSAIMEKTIPLLSLLETEAYIKHKISQVDRFKDSPEKDLPLCTDKDLWRKDPVFKYYKNPDKRSRSTKNFDNAAEANQRLAKDNYQGVVVAVPGQVEACKYCPAFDLCTQKDALVNSGELVL